MSQITIMRGGRKKEVIKFSEKDKNRSRPIVKKEKITSNAKTSKKTFIGGANACIKGANYGLVQGATAGAIAGTTASGVGTIPGAIVGGASGAAGGCIKAVFKYNI